jgi:hypothetical protein
VVFSPPYRQLERLVRGLGRLICVPAPDYSTLPLCIPKLELDLGYEPQEGEKVVIAVDGTGIQGDQPWGVAEEKAERLYQDSCDC